MKIFTADSFTDTIFAGNPAGICILERFPTEQDMQSIAAEVNLSETAFVVPVSENSFNIRWFTPSVEVALCGHATLAAAHILWNEISESYPPEIFFECKSGRLRAIRLEEKGAISLDFPSYATAQVETPPGLVEALGCDPIFVGLAGDDYLIELASAYAVIKHTPNIDLLAHLPCRGVIVTGRADKNESENEICAFDFASRFFGPRVGVPEDPVTGSAHCKLAPYWSQRLGTKVMRAFQASKRGGHLIVTDAGSRVYIEGRAVTVFVIEFSHWKPSSHSSSSAPTSGVAVPVPVEGCGGCCGGDDNTSRTTVTAVSPDAKN